MRRKKKPNSGLSIFDSPRQAESLPKRGKGKAILFFLLGGIGFAIFFVLLILPTQISAAYFGVSSVQNWWNNVPAKAPVDVPLPQHSTLLDKNGKPFAKFFSQNRIPVTEFEIPAVMKNAIISIEDQRFYTNKGWDLKGSLRAFVKTVTGQAVQGGSGITQQYVKNLIVFNAETPLESKAASAQNINRKATELKSAVELEKIKSKEEILTGYLNTVYFGDKSYGIGAAAKHYFNKKPADLTVSEAAMLAGIVNNATVLNPTVSMKKATERRNVVLTKMAEQGYISSSEAEKLKKQPIRLTLTQEENGCVTSAYPFYCAWVRDILETNTAFGQTQEQRDKFLFRGGLTITTALDPKVMASAQNAASAAMEATSDPAIGIAVVQPGTGQVPAIATNRNFGNGPGETEIIYPITPAFQNGSTFKPFTAVTAIEEGVSPAIRFVAGNSYIPEGRKYPDGGFHNNGDGPGGDFDMAGALAHSVNTWFVQLEDQIGVRATAETAYKMGIKSLPIKGEGAITEQDASLTLGTYETSPLQVANAYATIAAHGIACDPVAILKVTNAQNEPIAPPPANCQQVIRASTADSVANMMQGVIDSADEGRTGKTASLGRPAAGKTGTTDSTAAVWFAGFTPQYATAVWIGDPRGGFEYPLESLDAFNQTFSPVYGGGAPAMAWKITMQGALAGVPVVAFPTVGGDTFAGIPYVVPNVIGMPLLEASALLEKSGFRVANGKTPGPVINGLQPGLVTKTSPEPGTVLSSSTPDRVITVFVSPK